MTAGSIDMFGLPLDSVFYNGAALNNGVARRKWQVLFILLDPFHSFHPPAVSPSYAPPGASLPCTIQYRTSPYIAIRTEYEYEYGYEYEYRTTNDTVVYILNLHTNQPHTNLHTNGHYIHFYIQIALCQNYARLCSIMLVMLKLCQLCFMLRPCYYANSYAGIIHSPQRAGGRFRAVFVACLNAGAGPAAARVNHTVE